MQRIQGILARRAILLGGMFALLSLTALRVWAQKTPSVQETLTAHKMLLDTLWVMVTAFLVFWMQAGFAYVEGGLTRAKNTSNIMMKNLMDFCIGSVADGNCSPRRLPGWLRCSCGASSPASRCSVC